MVAVAWGREKIDCEDVWIVVGEGIGAVSIEGEMFLGGCRGGVLVGWWGSRRGGGGGIGCVDYDCGRGGG